MYGCIPNLRKYRQASKSCKFDRRFIQKIGINRIQLKSCKKRKYDQNLEALGTRNRTFTGSLSILLASSRAAGSLILSTSLGRNEGKPFSETLSLTLGPRIRPLAATVARTGIVRTHRSVKWIRRRNRARESGVKAGDLLRLS